MAEGGNIVPTPRLRDIRTSAGRRLKTGIKEFDFVLGGGIVPGSMILVGGEPGIGKSTLLLQVAGTLQEAGHKTLYVSGEESALQVKLRAERLEGSDRKSTRLNSSHLVISYAVFCLKKKKITLYVMYPWNINFEIEF